MRDYDSVVGHDEAEAVREVKEHAGRQAGIPVVKYEGKPAA
ncbi:hypothetical protein [Rhizobium leguminosarum]|nr:hypothetical protein [Rhizobium leguminosarum]